MVKTLIMASWDVVSFTEKKFEEFKKAQKKALEDKLEFFIFYNEEYLTSYAKYLIEYIGPRFERFKH